jgi:hypothetical protein
MNINAKPTIGAKIIVIDSDENTLEGSEGVITDIVNVFDETILQIRWDEKSLNDMNIALIVGIDTIFIYPNKNSEKLDESWVYTDDGERFFGDIALLMRYYGAMRDYYVFFETLRKSGVVNMLTRGLEDLIWMGRDQLDDVFPRGMTRDNEKFQELLDMADELRMKMISGTTKYVEAQILPDNPDADMLALVNKYIKKNSKLMYEYFINVHRL